MIRPGDIVIALAGAAVIAVLALNIYSDAAPHIVRVTQGDREAVDHPAWEDRKFSVAGPLGETVIEIHDGRARIVQSPCRKKICIRAGWLDAAGDVAACVPNRVSIALLGNDPRFDAINF
ncbi:MAG TPA: NusG domain II-containing protein [Gammaproteobacteria bacterium]